MVIITVDDPTISVVIPVLNEAKLLPRCLRRLKVRARTLPEIIVVDAGSIDGTPDKPEIMGPGSSIPLLPVAPR